MKKIKYSIKHSSAVAFASIFIGLTSCDSFTEVDLPKSQLTSVKVFEDAATADAAIRNVYASLRDEGLLTGQALGLSCAMGAYADELDFFGTNSLNTFYFYNNSILPSGSAAQTFWNTAYNQIYNANAVYEGVGASSVLPAADADRLRGEALFIRAVCHFYLCNLYGNVPYVRSTDYRVNATLGRMAEHEVYQEVIADLGHAVALLPEAYFSGSRARANKAVAHAFLARVYLYLGMWSEVENEASTVLNQADTYTLENNIANVFLKASPETIWQFPAAVEGRPTFEGSTFVLTAPPPTNVALRNDLVQSFDTVTRGEQLG